MNKYLPVIGGLFVIAVLIAIFTPQSSWQKAPLPLDSDCAGYKAQVCGWNGITYANECELMRAGTTLYIYGSCNSAVKCSKIENPVCGVDGQTYPNACVANKLMKIGVQHYGGC